MPTFEVLLDGERLYSSRLSVWSSRESALIYAHTHAQHMRNDWTADLAGCSVNVIVTENGYDIVKSDIFPPIGTPTVLQRFEVVVSLPEFLDDN